MKLYPIYQAIALSAALLANAHPASAAIALDRTRAVFDAKNRSETFSISNQNKTLSYLAQAWLEDSTGQKTDTPFAIQPPLQRVEPGEQSQIKIQDTGAASALPRDRESLFYFNLREIPPVSSRPNTLQIALQTRIKLFYRPSALAFKEGGRDIPQSKLTLRKEGDRFQLHNPTGYYVTIVEAAAGINRPAFSDFKPVMIAPQSSQPLTLRPAAAGSHPVLTYINDYGGRPKLIFSCTGQQCAVSAVKAG
ncbi:fimbria/pilus periplasmic chaperone [Pluralibacter gergoviae]|uniref:fimbria/pilus periplasmic chaperone n=1 Tax=Pluralibacter gergoviae TaxID=61647 RepID=UPI001FF0F64F|nr:fimbria/pilus periplasmic chaperone [Pluralibacter gergoviae]MCK1067794.1 fimbria/pilus periplasmic chaperone [Pluralibacter gergoviae]MCV7758999.1 fimbria/pilus periplasmic chaperone [Pluralibacter gergoviae]